MRISDWSSDVCSSDLAVTITSLREQSISSVRVRVTDCPATACGRSPSKVTMDLIVLVLPDGRTRMASPGFTVPEPIKPENPRKSRLGRFTRSEEHTSELQSLMRISYAVFCLKKKKKTTQNTIYSN